MSQLAPSRHPLIVSAVSWSHFPIMRVLGPSLSRTFKNKYFRAEYSSISYLEGSPTHHGCWWKLMILHVGCIQLRHQTCSVELCQGRSSRCPYQGETPIPYHIYLGLVEDLKCTNIMRINLFFLYTLPIKQQQKRIAGTKMTTGTTAKRQLW